MAAGPPAENTPALDMPLQQQGLPEKSRGDATWLERDQVEEYLAAARRIGTSHTLFDTHVHPFDMFNPGLTYEPDDSAPDVLKATGSAAYILPLAARLRIHDALPDSDAADRGARQSWALALGRRRYSHIGPPVLAEHMRLSGIGRILLLPVAVRGSGGDAEMERLISIYSPAEHVLLGYSVAGSVPDSEIGHVMKGAAERYPIRAVKVHPNRQDMDLGTTGGRHRMECILAAADTVGLPVVIHGGRSALLRDQGTAEHAVISKIARIDWGMTATPVIIAHAGAFDCSAVEVHEHVIPTLMAILSTRDNVMVDISGLGVDALLAVLSRVDPERILFGSDALYEAQWAGVARCLHTLCLLGADAEAIFVQVAARNPARVFLRQMEE